jgi:hypothetical protein
MFDALGTGGALVPERELEAAPSPLGQLLVERGHLTDQQLDSALAEQTRSGLPLGQVLIGLSYVTAATIAQALATQQGGLVKTEFGLATGFGTPGLVAFPPVSPPATAPLAAFSIEQEHAAAEAPQADVVALQLPDPTPVAPARNEALEAANAKIEALELELAGAASAESTLEEAESKIAQLESDLANARMDAARIPALEVDLAAARRAEAERDAHAAELAQARGQLASATENLTAAYERLQQYEAAWAMQQAQLAQQPRTASPFAWQS